jgi:hypothetical protein
LREKVQFSVQDCQRFNKCSECYQTVMEGEDNCLTLRPPPVDNKATIHCPVCILKPYLQTFKSSIAIC